MLSIRRSSCRARPAGSARVAARPLIPGIAQSITTTRGFGPPRAGRLPRRRSPRRPRRWRGRLRGGAESRAGRACGRRRENGNRRVRFRGHGVSLLEHSAQGSAPALGWPQRSSLGPRPVRWALVAGDDQAHQGPAFRGARNAIVPPTSAARSRMPTMPRPPPRAAGVETPCRDPRPRAPAVGREAQPYPGPIGAGMARDVAQRFLQHAVHMDADAVATGHGVPRARTTPDPRLPLDGRQIPVESCPPARPRSSDRWMQRLGQAAHVVERRLRDLPISCRSACSGEPGGARFVRGPASIRSRSGPVRARRAARARSRRSVDSRVVISCCASRGGRRRASASSANSRRLDESGTGWSAGSSSASPRRNQYTCRWT